MPVAFRHVVPANVALVAAAALCAALTGGCATYSDRVLLAGQAAAGGDYQGAVAALNKVIGVRSADQLPESWDADRALATLERSILLQSMERYQDAARDLSAAETELELIDLSRDPVGSLAGYLYSDSAVPYAALPTERLAMNPINLLNYLGGGDLSGAAVEARRFQAMREYLASENIDDHGVAALGTYLAGFVFEKLGEPDRALRYYEEALERARLSMLEAPVAELARLAAYRGPRIESVLATAPATTDEGEHGEILVVVSQGRVPHKVPERIPVGAAIGIAGAFATEDYRWLTRGAGKVVVYPELVATPSRLGRPVVRTAGWAVEPELLVDLGASVRREYDDLKPKIMAAALARLATRAAVAEGVRAGLKNESSAGADILALFFEGLLVAADRPDTRSWTMLPGRVYVARMRVPPGRHEVEVAFGDAAATTRRSVVDVPARGFATVVVTEPR